jgi:ABC-type Fe3+ transport system permease subunit
VNDVMQRAHDSLKRARESAIILAFMTAGALLLGAAVAWLAAREGGREREIGGVPKWEFALRRRALR